MRARRFQANLPCLILPRLRFQLPLAFLTLRPLQGFAQAGVVDLAGAVETDKQNALLRRVNSQRNLGKATHG
jgi:hypothetical protein